MGYEVLDDGDDGRRAAAHWPPADDTVEVRDLSSLPHPQPQGTEAARTKRRTTTLLAASLLALATGAGAYWAGHGSADQQAAPAGRPRVLAVAQPATLAMAGAATAASLRISIVNVGPVPVRVVTSAQVPPAPGATLVGLANGGGSRIAPGDARQVVAIVGISCASPTWVTPTLAVRGPDGEQQPVTVRDANLDVYQVNALALCGAPADSTLTATLGGTVRAPELVLRNTSDHDVAVIVDPHSPVPEAPDLGGRVQRATAAVVVGPPVELTTVPALPVKVPASSDVTVTLQLHVRGCLPLAALSMQPYVQLLGVPVVSQPKAAETSAASVDLTAVLRAELARLCG